MAEDKAILKVSMVDESTFAAIDSTTGRPDSSGLTFAKIEFESCEFTVTPVEAARSPTSCSTADSPPEQGQQRDDAGDILPLRRGTITLKLYVDNVGASGLTVPDMISFRLARTLLLDEGAPPSASSIITTGVSATRITPNAAADWEHGLIAAVKDNGRQVTSRITGTTGGDKILSPALPNAPANGSTARFFRQLYAKTTYSTSTVALRLEGIGMRWTALGCAVSAIEIEAMETGGLMATYTLEVAHWEEDHSNADVTCDDLDCNSGKVDVNALNVWNSMSSLYCGRGGTLVEPAESARTAIQVDAWKVSLSVKTSPKACKDNAIGMIGWRRSGKVSGTIDLPMCTTIASTFANDRANKAHRQLHLNAGPHAANNGFVVACGGVFHRTDPQIYERGEDIWRQKLSLGIGDYCGDTDSAPAAAGVDAYLILGWGL